MTDPRAVPQVAPVYPIEAMRAGIHGLVRLEAIVTPIPVALTIEMTFAISNEATSAHPSRLRLALLPYNALKKAVNAVFRLERVRSIS